MANEQTIRNDQPDRTPPNEERQAELKVARDQNMQGGKPPYRNVVIHTLGEVEWILEFGGWSGRFITADERIVNFSEAILTGTNLSGAVLHGANLSHAKLSSINLSKAGLQGANLSHAQLYNSILRGSDLRTAKMNEGMTLRSSYHGKDQPPDITPAQLAQAQVNLEARSKRKAGVV